MVHRSLFEIATLFATLLRYERSETLIFTIRSCRSHVSFAIQVCEGFGRTQATNSWIVAAQRKIHCPELPSKTKLGSMATSSCGTHIWAVCDWTRFSGFISTRLFRSGRRWHLGPHCEP